MGLRVIKMKILICDDTQSELSVTYRYVSEYFKEKNIHAKINTFTDPNLAINHLVFEEVNPYDLYILDIVMPQNGIDVAKEILKKANDATIIFATSSKEYAVDAFKIHATDYILKPLDKNEVYNSLDRILKTLGVKKAVWHVKKEDLSTVTIELDQIIYIESINRRMDIHLLNDEVITSTSLRTKFSESVSFDLKENNFLVSHNSYIVNMNRIKGIKDLEFIMENGVTVPISKRMLKEVKQEYINYLLG